MSPPDGNSYTITPPYLGTRCTLKWDTLTCGSTQTECHITHAIKKTWLNELKSCRHVFLLSVATNSVAKISVCLCGPWRAGSRCSAIYCSVLEMTSQIFRSFSRGSLQEQTLSCTRHRTCIRKVAGTNLGRVIAYTYRDRYFRSHSLRLITRAVPLHCLSMPTSQ